MSGRCTDATAVPCKRCGHSPSVESDFSFGEPYATVYHYCDSGVLLEFHCDDLGSREACERAAIAAWNDANACCCSCGLFGDGLCLESTPYEPVHPESRCPSWRAPGWDDADDGREGER